MGEQVVEIRLQHALLGFLAEVDQGCGGVGLHARLWGVKDGDDGRQDAVVEFLLHVGREIRAHLAQSVAASPADTWMGVPQRGDNEIENLLQLAEHLLSATLRDGRDSHESGVSVPPSHGLHHAGKPAEGWPQNDHASELVGQAIHALFACHVVLVAFFLLELHHH